MAVGNPPPWVGSRGRCPGERTALGECAAKGRGGRGSVCIAVCAGFYLCAGRLLSGILEGEGSSGVLNLWPEGLAIGLLPRSGPSGLQRGHCDPSLRPAVTAASGSLCPKWGLGCIAQSPAKMRFVRAALRGESMPLAAKPSRGPPLNLGGVSGLSICTYFLRGWNCAAFATNIL